MTRRFKEHMRRNHLSLNGQWDFAYFGDRSADQVEPDRIVFDDLMAVPGCFDATPAYAGVKGLAAYRTRLQIPADGRYRLIFDGVHHWARIYVNGQPVAEHVGGFTRFHVDLPDLPAGRMELIVLIDNRLDEQTCPLHLHYFDWYHFGGIARGVSLQQLPAIWIDRMTMTTIDWQQAKVQFDIRLGNDGRQVTVPLQLLCNGQSVHQQQISVDPGISTISFQLDLTDAEPWSPSKPNLHLISLQVADDDLQDRLGIRQVTCGNKQLCINGQPQRLLGFNRHEAHPQFGHSQPDQLMIADLQQIREMHCNFIRGSHYPQDIRFLDLCDELGICVWNEAIGWQQTAEQLNNPRFIKLQQQQCREMVDSAYNRPSVIMWGALNEVNSHQPECSQGIQTVLQTLRDLDPSRPITFACNHPFDCLSLALVDIISINQYPGWYGGHWQEIPQAIDKFTKAIEDAGHGDKPFILSEIGAGAIYGWRDWQEGRWTEQYQVELLRTVIDHLFGAMDQRYIGLAIWQFSDIRTEVEKGIGRPRCFNNKGVVDEYRRPKQAYYLVRELFSQYGQTHHD